MQTLLRTLLLLLLGSVLRAATPIPLVIDTDFSPDVGDLGAVGLACALQRLGYVQIVAIVINTADSKAAGAAAATCQWWQIPMPAIGTWKGGSGDTNNPSSWGSYLYDHFPHTGVGLGSTVPDATTVLRTVLAARSTNDLVISCIGPQTNLQALLASTADGTSSLSGAALVAAKVKYLVVMGGQFPESTHTSSNSPEANFATAPAAANAVATAWGTPIYYAGAEISTPIIVGDTLAGRGNTDLMTAGYSVAGYSSGRNAWDELTMLFAAQNGADFVRIRGTASIDSSTGANSFTKSSTGTHFYLRKGVSDALLKAKINALMGAIVTNSPLLTTWGTSSPGIARIDFGN